jgi:hypothetical protein
LLKKKNFRLITANAVPVQFFTGTGNIVLNEDSKWIFTENYPAQDLILTGTGTNCVMVFVI